MNTLKCIDEMDAGILKQKSTCIEGVLYIKTNNYEQFKHRRD